jgi:hypothetical protein
VADLLIVVDDIAKMVSTAIVCFPYAHRIMSEINIAIVTKELRHDGDCRCVCDNDEGH